MENDIDIANVSGNIKISPKNIKYDKRQKKLSIYAQYNYEAYKNIIDVIKIIAIE